MEILLDSKELSLPGHPDNLEEVISEVAAHHLNNERTIWSVKINGSHYSEIRPNDAQDMGVDNIRTLEIGTKSGKEIILDFLRDDQAVINTLVDSASKISEFFRMTHMHEAHQHYMLFLESYQYFFQMIQQSIDIILPDFQKIFIKEKSINQKVEALENLFNQMISSQANEDWIMLANLLEYELVPLLREWEELLPVIERMQ